jgi:hypothetical protein
MKYLLKFLTITPLKIIVWLWCFEWWSTGRLCEHLNRPTPSYFVGAIQFAIMSAFLTWFICNLNYR